MSESSTTVQGMKPRSADPFNEWELIYYEVYVEVARVLASEIEDEDEDEPEGPKREEVVEAKFLGYDRRGKIVGGSRQKRELA